jgi:hypothetical protein
LGHPQLCQHFGKFVEWPAKVTQKIDRQLGLRRLREATNPTFGLSTIIEYNELAGRLRAHARELVAVGRAEELYESPAIRRATG